MSIKSLYFKVRRVVSPKQLPPFVYRMDDRLEAFVRLNGLQPKGMRTDGAAGQFGPANLGVSVIEHVKKTDDATGASINTVDPWISFFAWHALQPISPAVMAFMHGYSIGGKIYKIDTAIAVANGYAFTYANEAFDLAQRRPEAAAYRGQREWSGYGICPSVAITEVLQMAALLGALNGTSAPAPGTLPWTAF